MTCSSCKNLDEKKKVDGAVSGSKYYCKKLKTYVSGDFVCEKYEKCYRSTDKCNEIYNAGREFDNDSHSAGFYLIIAIILIVITLLIYLFNPGLY